MTELDIDDVAEENSNRLMRCCYKMNKQVFGRIIPFRLCIGDCGEMDYISNRDLLYNDNHSVKPLKFQSFNYFSIRF